MSGLLRLYWLLPDLSGVGGGLDQIDLLHFGDLAPPWPALTTSAQTLDFSASTVAVNATTTMADMEIVGSAFGDRFTMAHDQTTISGGGGDDLIAVNGLFNGALHGGSGMDTLDMSAVAGTGCVFTTTMMTIGSLSATSVELDGFEFVRGTAQNDVFFGDGDGLRFEGGGGSDNFSSLGTDDIVDYSREHEHGGDHGILVNLSSDNFDDGSGLPSHIGASGRAFVASLLAITNYDLPRNAVVDMTGSFDSFQSTFILVGSVFADFFFGANIADKFSAEGGDDYIAGNGGNDTIDGGAGSDIVYLRHGRSSYTVSKSGNGYLIADGSVTDSDGTDLYTGVEFFSFNGTVLAAADLVRTAPVITSNGGAVRVAFSTGENVAAVQTVTVDDADGPAKLYSLGGADAALFSISAAGVLSFRAARDFETPTDAGKDNIYNVRVTVNDGAGGSDFQDLAITVRNVLGNVIAGSTANNTIDATHKISGKGSTGEEDKVDGKAGNDTINTGGGNDTLIGGLGKDVLTGGAGLDKFVFNAALNSAINVDTIKDFAHDLDLIQLDDAIFKKIGAKLDAGEFYAKAGAVKGHDANDRIIYDKATGKLYFDDDGSGSRAAIWFATLSTKPQALDHGDFGIV